MITWRDLVRRHFFNSSPRAVWEQFTSRASCRVYLVGLLTRDHGARDDPLIRMARWNKPAGPAGRRRHEVMAWR